MEKGQDIATQPLMAEGLQVPDYIVILIYLGGVFAVGWYFARQKEQQDDYFIASRRLPWMAVGLSIVATMLSTVTYLAAPGEMIQHGPALALGWLSLPLAFLIVNFLWVPFFMRLGVTSIYEYLERRFGLAARLTAAGLFVMVLRLLWMATVVLTGSRAVAQITHESMMHLLGLDWTIDQWLLVVLFGIGIFATLYTVLGGIKAVVWTDVAQFIALFGGALLTIVFVAWKTGTGPLDWWETTTSSEISGHEMPPLFSFDPTVRTTVTFTVLNAVFWYACTFIGDQVAVQRYLTTPSVSAAVKGNIVNFVGNFVVMILLAICGMALLSYYLDPNFSTVIADGISDPRDKGVADKVFPHFISYGLPVGISGLVVAALFAVAMSSLDSGINSVAAVLTIDVFDRLKIVPVSKKSLWLPRVLTLIVGGACTLMAFAMLFIPERYNIIGVTARTFNCALGPLAAMFVVGMFIPRVGQVSVVVATWLGMAISIFMAWSVELLWMFGATPYDTLGEATENLAGPSPFLITPVATTFTILAAALLSLVIRNQRREQTKKWLWKAVVKQKGKQES